MAEESIRGPLDCPHCCSCTGPNPNIDMLLLLLPQGQRRIKLRHDLRWEVRASQQQRHRKKHQMIFVNILCKEYLLMEISCSFSWSRDHIAQSVYSRWR